MLLIHHLISQRHTSGSNQKHSYAPIEIYLATKLLQIREIRTKQAYLSDRTKLICKMTSDIKNFHHQEHSYVGPQTDTGECTIIFGLKDGIGVLAQVLQFFQDNSINLKQIESRSSKKLPNHYEFLVILDGKDDASQVIDELRTKTSYLEIISRDSDASQHARSIAHENGHNNINGNGLSKQAKTTHWFPRRIRDMDAIADNVLSAGVDLKADHPGFTDPEYKKRREQLASIGRNYKTGMPIPRVEYTQQEIDTWTKIYDKIVPLYKKYACKEYNHIFPLMEENCGYRRDNIPQLEDVSNFLKDSTGFTLRPVAGLVSSRDFLAGLAHRVFQSTQYIRHSSKPDYTPEPDICHELLGHAPLFADPDFARFSQEIGLASLGAPDEYIERLSTCYWFTIEFGVCKQEGKIKAYGAGLLSSYGELEYSMSKEPKILPFDPFVTGETNYPVTEYQPVYFLAESFADAQSKLHDYAATIPRPAMYRYNAYTQSVETINTKAQIYSLVKDVKNEISLVLDSLSENNPCPHFV